MRERFDEIRAERDVHSVEPVVYNRDPHAGLWKQIALGIVGGLSGVGADQRRGLGGICAVRLGRAADSGALRSGVCPAHRPQR